MKSSVQVSRGIESLFGTQDENIRLIELGLNVKTRLSSETIEIDGEESCVARAEQIFEDYFALIREGQIFKNGDLNSLLRVVTADPDVTLRNLVNSGKQRSFGKKLLAPKTVTQRRYLEAIERNDLTFGIGPAGTGKTYLAVAMAVQALISKRVSRIILTRPAVEAGERLGFLPGTLQEKVDPYLRPLYDALYDMLEAERRHDDGSGNDNAAFEGVHLPLRIIAIPGKHDDERDFDNFGRLKRRARQTNPAVGAVEVDADVRHKNQRGKEK